MKTFHAHIYFDTEQRALVDQIAKTALNSPLKLWKIFDRVVGPHAKPMLELRFDDSGEDSSMQWLEKNRNGLSVLIHEDTGDDVQDHQNARWLGQPLPIRFEFFAEVSANPKIAIHSK